jgi:hypothetical protein
MPRHSNQQIADALSDVLGVTISRRAVADWRRGFTEIRAAYLLAAFELAGIHQVLEIGALPAMGAAAELAPAAGGQTRRWNGRPRLQVIGAGLSFLLLLLWALPHTPLRPYVDVIVGYASHIAEPNAAVAQPGHTPSHPQDAPIAKAPPRDDEITAQPLPAATPAPAATPTAAAQQVTQSAPVAAATPATATAAAAQKRAHDPAPAPAAPAGAASAQAGASGNQVPSNAAAPAQPPGLVPGVVSGVTNTLDALTGS